MDRQIVSPQSRSIMIVSNRASFAQVINEVFPVDQDNAVTTQCETFNSMNGRAGGLVFNHDVVIFEADPDDENEIHALEELLSKRSSDTVFLALTNNDVSIGKVQQLRNIGVDEVLPLSIDGDRIRAVVDAKISAKNVPTQTFHDGPRALGQVIPITQSRGGVGSTTVAVNLASSLAGGGASFFHKPHKSSVVLLDFDLQFGNANVFLDLEDNGGLLQIIESVERIDDRIVTSTLQRHSLGFDVLCAPTQVLPLQSMRPDLIEDILDILKMRYDYIIVDLPRAIVDWVEPIIKQAAHFIIVIDTSVPSVRQARRLMDLYREENVGLPIDVVVNREQRPLIKSELVREAENVLETKLNHWLPENVKIARKAVDLGQPIIEMKTNSNLGKALKLFASALSANKQNAKHKET
tara:strand:- start:188544 stop:189770 length:1227 start_codon:yes stop_codon:yes gene_type:complete